MNGFEEDEAQVDEKQKKKCRGRKKIFQRSIISIEIALWISLLVFFSISPVFVTNSNYFSCRLASYQCEIVIESEWCFQATDIQEV